MTQLLLDLLLDLKKDVTTIKEDTNKNTTNLDIHMVRWETSENRLDLQEEKLDILSKQIEVFQTHIKLANYIFKGGIALLSFVATVLGIIELIQKIQ